MLVKQIKISLALLAAVAATQEPHDPQQQPLAVDRAPVSEIPLLGFGTWNLSPSNASDVVATAISTGYRHIDGAKIYGNQVSVGKGIAKGLHESGLRREDVWVTSKLWNSRHVDDLSPEDAEVEVEAALNETLKELNLAWLDLYLIHFPVSMRDKTPKLEYLNTWKAMTKLPAKGLTRYVGISNFSPSQLHDIWEATPHHRPYAHQLEAHPYLPQSQWISENQKLGIKVTAYSPLGNANPTYTRPGKDDPQYVPPLLQNDLLQSLGKERGCTPAQVAIKWGLLRGTNVIPKSQHADRIAENWASAGCKLEDKDLLRLGEELPTKRFNDPSGSLGVHLFEGLEDSKSSVTHGFLKGLKYGTNVFTFVLGLLDTFLAPLGRPL